jgi:DNA-binding response OmpR family regulator
LEIARLMGRRPAATADILVGDLRETILSEVGILIVDDDVATQQALKNILDSEGWRVRIVTQASHALVELATGQWNLVIANVEVANVRGPLFAILRDLATAEAQALAESEAGDRKHIRALFLVSALAAKIAQPVLEAASLPYSLKPYHLHDFLEKVSELLVEAGAIAEPLPTIGGFGARRTRRRSNSRYSRETRAGAMFASRDDYQMSEEELAEWERQEEADRKKRAKELKDREHL